MGGNERRDKGITYGFISYPISIDWLLNEVITNVLGYTMSR